MGSMRRRQMSAQKLAEKVEATTIADQAQRLLDGLERYGATGGEVTASASLDRRTQAAEFLVEPLVAAVEVMDAVHPGLALGGKPRQDQGRAGPQVRGRHLGPAEPRLAAHAHHC